MGVQHPRVRRVADRVAGLLQAAGVDHVLVENGPVREAAQPVEDLPAVGRADVGGEEGLDAEPVPVLPGLGAALRRVVEAPGVALNEVRVLVRQLPRIAHGRAAVKNRLRQLLEEPGIRRQGVLGHAHKAGGLRVPHPQVPGVAVVKLPLGHVVQLGSPGESQLRKVPVPLRLLPEGFLRVHQDDFTGRQGLGLQPPEKLEELRPGTVDRDDHIHRRPALLGQRVSLFRRHTHSSSRIPRTADTRNRSARAAMQAR